MNMKSVLSGADFLWGFFYFISPNHCCFNVEKNKDISCEKFTYLWYALYEG